MRNYFNYFTEIEERFQQRRGTILLLSTLDWALIEMWREAGIPLEAVLRGIPMRRKFAKNYSIMRNLVFNPRTPMDLSLGLMKNLLIHDLKNLSGNKEVSDTVRKLALRMFKQKVEKRE